MYPQSLSLLTWYPTAVRLLPMSWPTLSLLTNVRPMWSQYEQKAIRTLSVFGVMRGSLIALIGTIAKALRSLDRSCLGLKTDCPVLDLGR